MLCVYIYAFQIIPTSFIFQIEAVSMIRAIFFLLLLLVANTSLQDQAHAQSKSKVAKSAKPDALPSFKVFETKPASLMAVLDTDGDGKLSGSEIDYATDQLLRLDANDNGLISADELPASGSMSKSKSGSATKAKSGSASKAKSGSESKSMPSEAAEATPAPTPANGGFIADYTGAGDEDYNALVALDANSDGLLTLDEMKGSYQWMFPRIDADKDGSVTPDELLDFATDL